MSRKITVFLSDEDFALLRKKATIWRISVAEVIRMPIQEACRPKSKEERVMWDSLDRIWAKTNAGSSTRIKAAVDKAVKEVRGNRKAQAFEKLLKESRKAGRAAGLKPSDVAKTVKKVRNENRP